MFDLVRPCSNCPFRKGCGNLFQMARERLREIRNAPAFQCHRTVDYSRWEDVYGRQGDRRQQCAGLMAVLARENQPNQIMQVAMRFGKLDLARLDPKREAYDSWIDVLRAHRAVYV